MHLLQFPDYLRQHFFSEEANMPNMTSMPSTNDSKNMLFKSLVTPNILHSEDNEIGISNIIHYYQYTKFLFGISLHNCLPHANF